MGSPKPSQDVYSGLDLIKSALWSFNLKKKERENYYFLELLQRKDYLNMLFSQNRMKPQHILPNPRVMCLELSNMKQKNQFPF